MSQSGDLPYMKTAFVHEKNVLMKSFSSLILFKGEQEVCSSLSLCSWPAVLKNWV